MKLQYSHLKQNLDRDKRIWPHSPDGSFTIKSYLRLAHAPNTSSSILKRIWSSFVPSKFSFLCWRLFYDIVPVDSVIASCQIPIVSKCLCCQNACQESSLHLFLKGNLANSIWTHFNNLFEIDTGVNIKHTLMLWFKRGKKGSMEYLCCTITPLLILWEVWKERCARKYEENYQWQ
ncbi:Ribonuclease h domain, partial [Thalictrum thalictroides]